MDRKAKKVEFHFGRAGKFAPLFVAASFLITCLIAFATGTSVGTYFVVIPILFPVGVMAGAAPEFMMTGCVRDWYNSG